MTTIDAHQHVWDLSAARYPWLGPQHAPIDRTMSFADLRPALRAAGIQATVLVQAADNDADTDAMVAAADANPEVAAIVAYLPLENPERAVDRLSELRADTRIVGIRNLIHDQPDPDWILRPDVDEGLGVLEAAGLAFDYVAVLPRHLEHLPTLSERHPNLRIVIDHLAKPPVGGDNREPWWSLIKRAAENPLVHAKVSGLYSSVGALGDWSVEGIRPYVDRAIEVFGADRLMFGGDWPISVLAGGYERVFEGFSSLIAGLDATSRENLVGATAERFYRIDAGRLRAAIASAEQP